MHGGLRWGFDLINVNFIRELSYRLHGPDIVIVTDEEDALPAQYFLSSEHLNELDDVQQVAARGATLKALFDGALLLSYGLAFRPEPRLGDLVDFRGDRRIGQINVTAPAAYPFSTRILTEPLLPSHEEAVSGDRIPGAIYLARTDGVVRGMLLVLGSDGITLRSLYSLRDFMKTHGFKDAAIAKAAATSTSEVNRFTHTANNFAASGTAARHGDLGDQPPPVPMPVARAAEIILKAARAFVDDRIRAATAARAAGGP